MTDPMQLLRASNPVRDCDASDFDRLLARLEDEPRVEGTPPAATRGRFVRLRATKPPRIAAGRRALAALVPVAVALAVAAVAIVLLHRSPTTHHSGPAGTVSYSPGQARGRVVPGSMHLFRVGALGTERHRRGAEWFHTTARQICVQAGNRLGYLGIDGVRPHDGRFHAWPRNTAVNARCIDRPARGGVALMVAQNVADSGEQLARRGGCVVGEHTRCPARDTTGLYFGLLGSSAAIAGYGSQTHPRGSPYVMPFGGSGLGPDGEYIYALPTATNACSANPEACATWASPPSSRAFVDYSGSRGVCVLRGSRATGLLSGDCPYGLDSGPSPN